MKDEDADDDEEVAATAQKQRRRGGPGFGNSRAKTSVVVAAIEADQRSRGVGWILGTSVAFEIVTLGVGCWLFSRRDF